MQEAIPYRRWLPKMPLNQSPVLRIQETVRAMNGSESDRVINGKKRMPCDLKKMVEENAVIVFAIKGCCMTHVVKRLLQSLGANPTVCEVEDEQETRLALQQGEQDGGRLDFPAVFIGGKLFGGLDRVIATHISGELTPLLKQAGALWL